MANVTSISSELLAVSTGQALAGSVGAQAMFASGMVDVVVPQGKVTVDSMPQAVYSTSGTVNILTPRSDASQALTLSEASSTVSVGAIPVELKLSYTKIETINALIGKSLVGDSAIESIEAWIAQEMSRSIWKGLGEWVLTGMYSATAGASGTPMTVAIDSETSPADYISSASVARKALADLFSKFGEDVTGFAGYLGSSKIAGQFHGLTDGNNNILYPRKDGLVQIDGMSLIQSDLVDRTPSGALLSAIKGTQVSADHSVRRLLRTYLVKKGAALAVLGADPETLVSGIKITPCVNADGDGTGPGISIFSRVTCAVAVRTVMPNASTGGVACLVSGNGIAAS